MYTTGINLNHRAWALSSMWGNSEVYVARADAQQPPAITSRGQFVLRGHKLSHRRALHSINVKHGCHCGPVFLPEKNLGEKISCSRRIILRLLPHMFHSPQTVKATWGLSLQAVWQRGIDKDSEEEETLRGHRLETPTSVNITPTDIQDGITTGDAQPVWLSGEPGAAWPRPPPGDWLEQDSITSSRRELLHLIFTQTIFNAFNRQCGANHLCETQKNAVYEQNAYKYRIKMIHAVDPKIVFDIFTEQTY